MSNVKYSFAYSINKCNRNELTCILIAQIHVKDNVHKRRICLITQITSKTLIYDNCISLMNDLTQQRKKNRANIGFLSVKNGKRFLDWFQSPSAD